MLIFIPWLAARLFIAHETLPVNGSILRESLCVTGIDSPIIAALALLAAFSIGRSRRAFLGRILFFHLFPALLLLNTAAVHVAFEFRRPLSLHDLLMFLDPSFVRGSMVPAFLTMRTVCLFLLPLIPAVLAFRYIRIRNTPLSVTGLALTILLLVLPIREARVFGYANPTSRSYAAAASLYFHSLWAASEIPSPLTLREKAELKKLRAGLFRPAHTPGPADRFKERQNILLVILESFRREEYGLTEEGIPVTPNLVRAASRGVLFDRFYSNGFGTNIAIWSCLTGELGYHRSTTHLRAVSDLLHGTGYFNYWFHGNTREFGNAGDMFLRLGFDHLYDIKEFPDATQELGWGIADQRFFPWVNGRLDSLYALRRPIFSIIQSISSHHPFTVPDSFRLYSSGGDPNRAAYLNGLHYADDAFGRLLDHYFAEGWDRNTYLIIMGDHGYRSFVSYPDMPTQAMARHHLFCIVLGPGVPAGETRSMTASQVDIPGTLLSMAGLGSAMGLGSEMLSGLNRPAFVPITLWQGGTLLITDSVMVALRPEFEVGVKDKAPADLLARLEQFDGYVKLWNRLIANGQEGMFAESENR